MWPAIRAVLILFFSVAILIGLGLYVSLNKDQWASWVQAIGSVLAIVAAIEIGRHQSLDTRAAVKLAHALEEEKKLASIFAICTAAKRRATTIREIFCESEYRSLERYRDYDNSMMHGVIKAMLAVPVHEIGNPEAVIAFMEMRDQLEFTIYAIDAFDGPSDPFIAEQPEALRFALREQEARIRRDNIKVHIDAIDLRHEALMTTIGPGRRP